MHTNGDLKPGPAEVKLIKRTENEYNKFQRSGKRSLTNLN
jgi:hypothetical protein